MATIEKRTGKNGKTTYRITVASGVDISGKQIRYRKTWEPPKPNMTERQIEKALSRAAADFEREIEQGYRPDGNRTFAEYAKYVIELKGRTQVKTRTTENYTNLLDRVNAAIGHIKISDVRPQHLNSFYENLAKEGVRLDGEKAKSRMDIRKWIKDNKLSIAKLAKSAGVASATVSAILSGNTVRRKTAENVARAMGLPLSQVFDLEINTEPLSNKTILEHHQLISTIMAQAEKEMLIPYNPASKASPPKAKRPKPDYYQSDEIGRILDELENAPLKWRTATYLLIDTGCRRGEIMGLKWDSIDIDCGVASIDNNLLYSRHRGVYEDTTKSERMRALRLAPETIKLLCEWREEQTAMRDAYGNAWTESGFIFTQANGKRMHPDSITAWLNKFSKDHDLPHIHPHAFRHTAASLMIANGIDIVTAANELGHSDATTTTTIYAHQIAEAKARAENVRAGIFKRK